MKTPNIIIKWIDSRIKQNKNCIIIINGSTGSGKTYSGLTLCDDYAKFKGTNFTAEENVGFTFSDILKKMILPQNKKKGTPFLFEEVGAIGGGASSREWQSRANKFFFSFMQTARHLNQVLVFTCPSFAALEKGTRELVHMQLLTQTINFKKRVAYLKPYILQVNVTSGKIYFKFLRYRIDGQRYKLKRLSVEHPRKELVDPYEKMKTSFTSKLRKDIIESDKDFKQRKSRRHIDLDELKRLSKKGLTQRELSKILNVSKITIQRYQKELKDV